MTCSRSTLVALCAVITALVLTLVFRWWGLSLLAAVLAVVLLSCPITMAYAWWVERRMERDVKDAVKRFGRAGANEEHHHESP